MIITKDYKYYKEKFDVIEYKDFKFTKLTFNHLEEIISSSHHFSEQEYQILQYMEKYCDKEIWFISKISADMDEDIIDNIKVYDIIVKINDHKIKEKKDIENAIKSKTKHPYILTKSRKIIFI